MGLWVIVAVVLIVDSFLFSALLLDSLFPGLSGIVNVLIFALIPFIFASLLLDRRSTPSSTPSPSRQPPRGARSASGEPISRTRPKPRIKRDKRAEQLETIVVEPGAIGNSSGQSNLSATSTSNSQQPTPSSSRFLRSRRTQSEENHEMDQQVKDQLDAIELEMAKLEEQLEQNGVSSTQTNSNSVSPPEPISNSSPAPAILSANTLSSEEATSELQAIDELLARLEQRKRAGGVDEDTYERLREKYLKRRSELA